MMQVLTQLFNLVDHILPLMITLTVLVMVGIFVAMRPTIKKAFLVAQANTQSGIEDLARYMAKKTCGRNADVESYWHKFIPAAKALSDKHQERLSQRAAGL